MNVQDPKQERHPIIITYDNKEQLIYIPKIPDLWNKEQALAVCNAL